MDIKRTASIGLTVSLLLASTSSFANYEISGQFIRTSDPKSIVIQIQDQQFYLDYNTNKHFDALWDYQKAIDQETMIGKVIVFKTKEATKLSIPEMSTTITVASYSLSEYWIEHRMKNCGYSTLEMNICASDQATYWDDELNRAYKLLNGSADSNLKRAQRSWLKFRDEQIQFYQSEYSERQGTMWTAVYIDMVKDLTKQQAKRLYYIYSDRW
ncbi:lysozyme inhibitor LprI family protein [Vibrio breoganii]